MFYGTIIIGGYFDNIIFLYKYIYLFLDKNTDFSAIMFWINTQPEKQIRDIEWR